ncbi:lamin tail domain-containing protein [Verrucomicrobiales bacterium]|nr:lamin tail domain-containing protein [Verrucomicrobiales bacterium]
MAGLLPLSLYAAPPVIQSFSTPDTQVVPGITVPLQWNVSNADSISISQGVGDVTGLSEAFVSPLAQTTYTLTATNGDGASTAQVTISLPTAIGISGAGYRVEFIESTGRVNNLGNADQLLAGNNVASSVVFNGVSEVNYGDSSNDGELPGSVSFPSNLDNDFILHATGTLIVNAPGIYTLAINNDDGGRLRIDGETVILDDAQHGALTTEVDVDLSAGSHSIDYVFFERGGGAAGELLIFQDSEFQALTIGGGTAAPVTTPTVVINEFVANAGGENPLLDGDGEAEDWIEIFNGTASTVNLGGYSLSDDVLLPAKWSFPAGTTIAPGGFLIVFASDKADNPPAGEFHTNFRLSSGGEYLALYNSAGTVLTSFADYPEQFEDVSYGFSDTERFLGYLPAPSPGSANNAAFDGFVADTKFSVNRGVYDTAFSLEIISETSGAEILYTLDGSAPTFIGARNGTIYSEPLSISETTALRAMAWKPGFVPTNIDTNTYIFPADVVTQNTAHATNLGFPASPVNGQVFEYGMDTGVTNGNQAEVEAALRAIPSYSLVIPQDDLNGPDGIYTNAGVRGDERAVSFELINEAGAGAGQFQVDCGLRIRGGFSRSDNNPKHAFRCIFRNRYGAGKLEYPIFGSEGTDEFDILDLRTAQNNSWSFQNSNLNTFLREVSGRDAQRAMEQPYTRSRYFHLYLNSHYWGLFMTQERVGKDYGESYFGGDDDEFDTVKSGGSSEGYRTEFSDGNDVAWRELFDGTQGIRASGSTADYYALQGLAADGETPTADPVLLDVDNLSDYMLTIFYSGAFDTALSTFVRASNNWFTTRNRVRNDLGFQFFYHDGEHGLGSDINSGGGLTRGIPRNRRSSDRTGPFGGDVDNNKGEDQYGSRDDFDRSNPQYLHEDLATLPEYRLQFADRAFKHLVKPGGALNDTVAVSRIADRAATVEQVIIAEAARWGNATSQSPATWANARDDLYDWINDGGNEFIGNSNAPGRAAEIISQLRAYNDDGAKPLYPSIDPPTFSATSGTGASGFQLTLTPPTSGTTIFFTTDGSDPRGGTVYTGPITLDSSVTVRARAQRNSNSEWSPLDEETYLVGALASSSNIVISEIHYHPAGPDEDEYEFIEITHVGSGGGVDLSGAAFTNGISYAFPLGTVIEAGESIVIARNLAFFASRYPGVSALGPYTGGLRDSGETVTLTAEDGSVIASISYSDDAPWPKPADGDGYSLTLANPVAGIDYNDPANWTTSSSIGGSPGVLSATSYATFAAQNSISSSPDADDDSDGLSNFLEYALGLDPGATNNSGSPRLLEQNAVDPTVYSFTRALDIFGTVRAEVATELESWTDAQIDSVENLGDGTERVSVRLGTGARLFIRLRATDAL